MASNPVVTDARKVFLNSNLGPHLMGYLRVFLSCFTKLLFNC